MLSTTSAPWFLIILHKRRSKTQFKVGAGMKTHRHLLREGNKNEVVVACMKWQLTWIFWYVTSYTVWQGILLQPRIFSAHLRGIK